MTMRWVILVSSLLSSCSDSPSTPAGGQLPAAHFYTPYHEAPVSRPRLRQQSMDVETSARIEGKLESIEDRLTKLMELLNQRQRHGIAPAHQPPTSETRERDGP